MLWWPTFGMGWKPSGDCSQCGFNLLLCNRHWYSLCKLMFNQSNYIGILNVADRARYADLGIGKEWEWEKYVILLMWNKNVASDKLDNGGTSFILSEYLKYWSGRFKLRDLRGSSLTWNYVFCISSLCVGPTALSQYIRSVQKWYLHFKNIYFYTYAHAYHKGNRKGFDKMGRQYLYNTENNLKEK